MNDETMTDLQDLDLQDLGDVTVETKQCCPAFVFPDNLYGYSYYPH